MRKTKQTLKSYRPLARSIAEEANRLDLASRRLHKLADQVNDAEIDAGVLRAERLVKVPPQAFSELEENQTGDGLTWKERSIDRMLSEGLRQS